MFSKEEYNCSLQSIHDRINFLIQILFLIQSFIYMHNRNNPLDSGRLYSLVGNIYCIQNVYHIIRLNLSSKRVSVALRSLIPLIASKANAISLLMLVPEPVPTGTKLISAVIIV